VLLQSLPVPHQTLLFSATMPKEIEQLAAQYLNKPVKVKIGRVSVPTANVAQTLQRCAEGEKVELLVAMLQVGASAWPHVELWVEIGPSQRPTLLL
jgi:ATP-dependent RNA helicase DDX5/DBP2